MGKQYKPQKPQYYKIKHSRFKRRYLFLLLLIPLVLAGGVLIIQSQERMAVITKLPSDDAVLDVPPTPAVLSDEEGYSEEAFVTSPTAFSYSDPEKLGFRTYIMAAGEEVDKFEYKGLIRFPEPADYTDIAGVLTYRGNNYRSSGSYGAAKIDSGAMQILWTHKLPEFALSGPSEGTSQPLVVRWPADIMGSMSFKSAKKGLVQLTEVIFADKSGDIYFLDIDDGELTRTPIPTIAYTQGTPTLDPRGYPLLFVGQSIQEDGNVSRSHYQYLFVINLITGKPVFRFGSSSVEPFSDNKWQGYGGSPLVYDDHVMIEGESGILYMYEVGSNFELDKARVTINDEPDLYKYKYENPGTGYQSDYDDGEENTVRNIDSGTTGSLAGYQNYVLFSDRSGYIQCIDLNHMSLIYAVDIDGNGDFTLSLEGDGFDANAFSIYSGTRLEYEIEINGDDGISDETEAVYFRKINGLTGKIEWENAHDCLTRTDFRGGISEACAIGEKNLAKLVIYSVVMEEGTTNTKLYAVNKSDGSLVWEKEIQALSKSAPTVFYDEAGKGYVVVCDADGYARLYDGLTGSEMSTVILEAGADGTPVVYSDKMVVHLENDSLVCVKID